MAFVPFRAVALASLLLLGGVLAPAAAAAPPPAEGGRFAVGFHGPPGLSPGDEFHGGRVLRVDGPLGFAVVRADDPPGFRHRAEHDPKVRYVAPDPLLPLVLAAPGDPLYGQQHAPAQVRAPAAWDTTHGSTAARVCILDTGIRYTHEDLAGPRWLGGTDLVQGDGDPWDDHGHGTHVAGIAAAGLDNGKGIAGMGNVGLLGVKVLRSDGAGYLSDVATGVRWCADQGPRVVVSMSLGASADYGPLHDGVVYAAAKGALLVAAAGNSGPCSDCVGYPARYAEVVAVTCTTSSSDLCWFSSTGAEAEVAAPGAGILSTFHRSDADYAHLSGTSMSTPLVAGAAALAWSHNQALSAATLRTLLACTAQDLGAAGRDAAFGHGQLDAARLVEAAGWGACTAPPVPEPAPPVVEPPPPEPTPPPPPPRTTFNATFTVPGSVNEWWVEVRVQADETVTAVDAIVNGGASRALELRSWGNWAKSFRVLPGSQVVFQARTADNLTATSQNFTWLGEAPAPAPAPAPANLGATFTPKSLTNNWWVEVKVNASQPLAKVEASDDGGPWVNLPKTSYGSWAKGMAVADGSQVRFRATSTTNATNISAPFAWGDAPAPAPTNLSATFTPKSLTNNWWVEAKVSASQPLAKVEASDDGGAWVNLPKTSWGSWAKGMAVADGSQVRFRATSTSGATALSGAYTWG